MKHQTILASKSIAVVYFVQKTLESIFAEDDMDMISNKTTYRLIFYGNASEFPVVRFLAAQFRPIYHTLPTAYRRKFCGR